MQHCSMTQWLLTLYLWEICSSTAGMSASLLHAPKKHAIYLMVILIRAASYQGSCWGMMLKKVGVSAPETPTLTSVGMAAL